MVFLGNLQEILDESKHNHDTSLFYTLNNKKDMWEKRLNQAYVNGKYYLHEQKVPKVINQYISDYYLNGGHVKITENGGYDYVYLTYTLNTNITNYQKDNLILTEEYLSKEVIGKEVTFLINKLNDKSIKLTIPVNFTEDYIYQGLVYELQFKTQKINITNIKKPSSDMGSYFECDVSVSGLKRPQMVSGWLNYNYGKQDPYTIVSNTINPNQTVHLKIPRKSNLDSSYHIFLNHTRVDTSNTHTLYSGDYVTGNI